MITENEIKAYRRAAAAVEKARAARNAVRPGPEDEASYRLRLAVAEAEIDLHNAELALDAADESVAELDAFLRRAARTFAATQEPATVARLEGCSIAAVESYAAALAAAQPKATEREANQHAWYGMWLAARDAIELHTAERHARGLPRARWSLPSTPDFRELLGERPAPPVSSSVTIAADLRRELRPSDFTARPTRGAARGDLEDARSRRAAG